MFEPTEVARWERLTTAMIRRTGQDDPEAFAAVVKILDSLPDQLRAAAAALRATTGTDDACPCVGYSWADIARPLGVTRSAAAQRFGMRSERVQHPGDSNILD